MVGLDVRSVICSDPETAQRNLTLFAVLDPQQRARLDRSQMAREQIADFRVMNIDFFPRESRLVTFRDPWSFPVLFHPGCNHLIRGHLQDLAQKVTRHREPF
jgi:syntaxin-binding protein 1